VKDKKTARRLSFFFFPFPTATATRVFSLPIPTAFFPHFRDESGFAGSLPNYGMRVALSHGDFCRNRIFREIFGGGEDQNRTRNCFNIFLRQNIKCPDIFYARNTHYRMEILFGKVGRKCGSPRGFRRLNF